MFFVYVLLSKKDNKFYTGLTEDIHSRFKKHCGGGVESTRHRRPLSLIYYEAYIDEDDAVGREKFLKSGSGKVFLKKQLKNYLNRYDRGVEQPGSSQGS